MDFQYSMDFQVTSEKLGPQIGLLRIIGEINLHSQRIVGDAINALLLDGCRALIIDLAEVPYLDSAALALFVDAVRRIHSRDGLIVLVATTPFVRRAFEITRLVKIFTLTDTIDEATAFATAVLARQEIGGKT